MEEALQSGKTEIAEYLAPRTRLQDDKIYSTIHESQIYADCGAEPVDEEEDKKSEEVSDNRSLQSEEAMRPDDYQAQSEEARQAQKEARRQANKEAAE